MQHAQTQTRPENGANDRELEAMVAIQDILKSLPDERSRQRTVWYFMQREGLVGKRGRRPAWMTELADEAD